MPTQEELKRKKIKCADEIDIYNLEGTLASLVTNFTDLSVKYGSDAIITVNRYYDDIEVSINYEIEETDTQYNTRIERIKQREFKEANPSAKALASAARKAKIEEKKAEAQKKADLKLLAELKKKYE